MSTTALLPSEMDAAKRALERMQAKPPVSVVFPVLRAITPAAPVPPRVRVNPPPLPLPPPRRGETSFPPGENFVAALDHEAAEERRLAREAAKLEPLVITISDQVELRALYELAGRLKSKPVPMLRRRIREWGRVELHAKRAEQNADAVS